MPEEPAKQTPDAAKPVVTKETTVTKEATVETAPTDASQKTSGLAVASLVLTFFIPLIGLILGIVALSSIKKSGEGGRGLAKAAIIISSIFIFLYIVIFGSVIYAFQRAAKDSGVNLNSGGVSVTGKDGESASFGSDAKVPDGFPSDVPIYEPSDIIASAKTAKNTYTVSLLTVDSISKVRDYYSTQLAKEGWKSGESNGQLNFASGSIATFTKGSQTLGVLIAADKNSSDGKTSVTLTVVPTDSTN